MARPSKFEDARPLVLKALEAGLSMFGASGHAGVDHETVTRWRRRYARFAHECTVAEQTAAARMESRVIQAVKDDPAHAWKWLAKRRKEDWGDRLDVNTTGGITVTRVEADEEAIVAAADAIRCTRAALPPLPELPAGILHGDLSGVSAE